METPLCPFQPLGPTVGWQTTTDSIAFPLPAITRAAPQVRVFNATAGQPLYAYVAFGDSTIKASPWTEPPPATCDYIIGPDSSELITLTGPQLALAREGKLYAAACLYQGAGGIYFTPGVGQR